MVAQHGLEIYFYQTFSQLLTVAKYHNNNKKKNNNALVMIFPIIMYRFFIFKIVNTSNIAHYTDTIMRYPQLNSPNKQLIFILRTIMAY